MPNHPEYVVESANWPEGLLSVPELLKAIAYKQPKIRRWVPLKLALAGLLLLASLTILASAALIAFGHTSAPVRAVGLLSVATLVLAYALIQAVDLYEVIRHGSGDNAAFLHGRISRERWLIHTLSGVRREDLRALSDRLRVQIEIRERIADSLKWGAVVGGLGISVVGLAHAQEVGAHVERWSWFLISGLGGLYVGFVASQFELANYRRLIYVLDHAASGR